MAETKEVNLNFKKQWQKFNYPVFTAIRRYDPSTPEFYCKDTIFNILIKGLLMFKAKLLAVRVVPFREIPNDVVQFDMDMTLNEFRKRYKTKYSEDDLFSILILLRQ